MSPWLRSKWWTYGNETFFKKFNARVKFLYIQNKYSTPRGTLMEIRNSWFFWGFTPCVLWSNGIYTHIQIFFYDSKFYGSLTITTQGLQYYLKRYHERYSPAFPVGNYVFKVSNRKSRTRFEICSKLTIKTSEWRPLVFLLLTLSRWIPTGFNIILDTIQCCRAVSLFT